MGVGYIKQNKFSKLIIIYVRLVSFVHQVKWIETQHQRKFPTATGKLFCSLKLTFQHQLLYKTLNNTCLEYKFPAFCTIQFIKSITFENCLFLPHQMLLLGSKMHQKSWAAGPDPAGGAYSAPPDPLAEFGWDRDFQNTRTSYRLATPLIMYMY